MIDTPRELGNLIMKVSEISAQRTMERLGIIPNTITLSEAYRLQGRTAVDRAIRNGKLKTIKKGGKTAKIKINRSEFDQWALVSELSSEYKYRK